MPNRQPILSGPGPIFFPDAGTFAYITSTGGLLNLHSAGTNQHLDVYTTGTGVFRVNGVPLAPSAYTDTTNASNITTGVLPVAQVPNAIKAPTTFSAIGAGKSFGVIYQNTGSTVRWVAISFTPPSSVPVRVFCDASSSPANQVCITMGLSSAILFVFFLVLPGYFYRISQDSGSVTLQAWDEWN